MFKKKKIKIVDIDEMNEHLKFCQKNRALIKENPKFIKRYAFFEDKMVKFELTYKNDDGETCTYIAYKDGRFDTVGSTGLEAYRIVSKYYKVPHRKANFSASPFLYKNDKYDGTRNKAYGYDLNSAYSWAMTQPMPDTSVNPVDKIIEDNEIGFDLDGNILSKGEYGFRVFPLIESPFKDFVNKWYEIKRNPKNDEEKKKAKSILNMSVGYLQRINPYLRATILHYCNSYMESLIDENTLYCNTDSLVSLTPRNDLKLGTELGEWKIEHVGEFAFRGFNYQWDSSVSYRGIPKSWFKKDFDILKDDLPYNGNIHEFDSKKFIIKEINYGIKID